MTDHAAAPRPERSQEEQVALRNADPVAWLRDKAERRVPIDARGPDNAAAVLEVCRLAEPRVCSVVLVDEFGSDVTVTRIATVEGRTYYCVSTDRASYEFYVTRQGLVRGFRRDA